MQETNKQIWHSKNAERKRQKENVARSKTKMTPNLQESPNKISSQFNIKIMNAGRK